MEDQNVEISIAQLEKLLRYVRRARFVFGIIWKTIEEVEEEITSEKIALPDYVQLLLEDVSVRADDMNEQAKHLLSEVS